MEEKGGGGLQCTLVLLASVVVMVVLATVVVIVLVMVTFARVCVCVTVMLDCGYINVRLMAHGRSTGNRGADMANLRVGGSGRLISRPPIHRSGMIVTMDYWRDLDTGPESPEIIYAVIESPKGTENKYEYDVKKKAIVLDRVLYSAVHFPGDYGFLPRTLDEDGDPLDILVLVTTPTFPGCIMTARPVGLLRMLDGDKRDDKILAVPNTDPRYSEYHDLRDLPEHILKEIAYLFETYKVLEGKQVKILGWDGARAAKAVITECQTLYQNTFREKRT